MDDVIQISKLNDFLFCPLSLYLHSIYDNYEKDVYHEIIQKVGSIKHESIDKHLYSSSKHILQGIRIYSDKYRITGKLDLYDKRKKLLIERKNKVHKLYKGLYYQVYAEYFCLLEMGYQVEKILIYSLSDNKKYVIPLPNKDDISEFEDLIRRIRNFEITSENLSKLNISPNKCAKCIYRELCTYSKC